ncbi:hypothetical protein O6215_23950, partial [Salmonella enterica subsp. enterica]
FVVGCLFGGFLWCLVFCGCVCFLGGGLVGVVCGGGGFFVGWFGWVGFLCVCVVFVLVGLWLGGGVLVFVWVLWFGFGLVFVFFCGFC